MFHSVGGMVVRNDDGSLACICHEHNPVCRCVEQDPERRKRRFCFSSIDWLAVAVRRLRIFRL